MLSITMENVPKELYINTKFVKTGSRIISEAILYHRNNEIDS